MNGNKTPFHYFSLYSWELSFLRPQGFGFVVTTNVIANEFKIPAFLEARM